MVKFKSTFTVFKMLKHKKSAFFISISAGLCALTALISLSLGRPPEAALLPAAGFFIAWLATKSFRSAAIAAAATAAAELVILPAVSNPPATRAAAVAAFSFPIYVTALKTKNRLASLCLSSSAGVLLSYASATRPDLSPFIFSTALVITAALWAEPKNWAGRFYESTYFMFSAATVAAGFLIKSRLSLPVFAFSLAGLLLCSALTALESRLKSAHERAKWFFPLITTITMIFIIITRLLKPALILLCSLDTTVEYIYLIVALTCAGGAMWKALILPEEDSPGVIHALAAAAAVQALMFAFCAGADKALLSTAIVGAAVGTMFLKSTHQPSK